MFLCSSPPPPSFAEPCPCPEPWPPSPPVRPAAGLNLLHELLVMFVGSGVATQFHQAFYTQLVQEIFAVMTGGWAGPRAPAVSAPTYDFAWCRLVRNCCGSRFLCCGLLVATAVFGRRQTCHRRLHSCGEGWLLGPASQTLPWPAPTHACFCPHICADTFHKPGFKLQTRILHHLFTIVQARPCPCPLARIRVSHLAALLRCGSGLAGAAGWGNCACICPLSAPACLRLPNS